MKKVFIVLLNMFIFFFIISALSPALKVNAIPGFSGIINGVIVGLIYGVFILIVPNILKFFKISPKTGALYLMGVIVSFFFYFIMRYIFGLIQITGGNVVLLPGFSVSLVDSTVAIVFISLFSAVVSISMQQMANSK